MKKLFLSPILAGSILSLFLFCGCEKEEESLPEVKPAPAVVSERAQPSESAKIQEPELQPIKSLNPPSEEPTKAPSTATIDFSPQKEGSFVIQIGIQPSKKSAGVLVNRLKDHGIEAYLARVENPGELEGTYYRVRIGFFQTTTQAQNFGKQTLEPLGFAWWVDNHSNDDIGNFAQEDAAPSSPIVVPPQETTDITEDEAIPSKETQPQPVVEQIPETPIPEEPLPQVQEPVKPKQEPAVEKIESAPAAPLVIEEDDWDSWE